LKQPNYTTVKMNTEMQHPFVRQSFSLRLPNVSIYFNPAIIECSELSAYGKVNRTDLVLTWTPEGKPYFQAFIHYHFWYNTIEAALFQEQVSNKNIRLVLPQGIGTVYENTSPDKFMLSSLEFQHTPEEDTDFENFWDETMIDTLTQTNAEEYCELIDTMIEMEIESNHQDRIGLWTPEEAGILNVNDEPNYLGYTCLSNTNMDLKFDPLNLNKLTTEHYCTIEPGIKNYYTPNRGNMTMAELISE
jgi:hypothetical protein